MPANSLVVEARVSNAHTVFSLALPTTSQCGTAATKLNCDRRSSSAPPALQAPSLVSLPTELHTWTVLAALRAGVGSSFSRVS